MMKRARIKQVFFLMLFLSFNATYAECQEPSAGTDADYSKYILTPEPPDHPRINGARIFGVRPGKPVIYSVAATGRRPMDFSADYLPEGLSLDRKSGRISGSVIMPGEYKIKITARNDAGTASGDLKIVVGEKIALTPPMGWNSWNGWGDHVTGEKVRTTADAMVKTALADHGWTYINLDVGWQGRRGGSYNAIQPNNKFSDMKGLCDYIHSLGLKAGLYSTPWVRTYFGYTGGSADNDSGYLEEIPTFKGNSKDHHFGKFKFDRNDVRQWDEWGIDYLKYDWGSPSDKPDEVDHPKVMSEALKEADRDIVFSLCNLFSIDQAPGKTAHVNLFRTTNDIRDVWDRVTLEKDQWAQGVVNIINTHREFREFTRPGCWADPDMLVVGWLGFGDEELHHTRLTPDEQYSHISMWCLWSAPLFIGSPVEKLDKFTISLLSNDEVLEVDQDPLGRQAYLAYKNGPAEVWVKKMEDGSKAAGLFNMGDSEIPVVVPWDRIGVFGRQRVRDLWRQKDLGYFTDQFSSRVNPHGVVLIKLFSEPEEK